MIKRLTAPNLKIDKRLNQEYNERFKGTKTLSRENFRKALILFNKKLVDAIIFDNFEFKILGLGTMYMIKYKIPTFYKGKINSYLNINWPETKKYGKYIYNFNEHTHGYKYKIILKKIRFKYRSYYRFRFSRLNRIYLAKILKNPDVYGKIDAPLIR